MKKQVITDDVIRQVYLKHSRIDYERKLKTSYLVKHGYYDYLKNRFDDSSSIAETIYRICYKIKKHPICGVCGKPARFINIKKGFDSVCTNECKRETSIPEITLDYIKLSVQNKQIYNKNWKGHDKAEAYMRNQLGPNYPGFNEAVYLVTHNLDEQPVCPICGKPIPFNNKQNRYDTYCSYSCYIESKEKKDKKKESKGTSIEKIVENILKRLDVEYYKNFKVILYPKELDFFIPDYGLAIECNGPWWHNEKNKSIEYHYNKFKECEEKGIHLLTLWENDIEEYRSKIADIIASCCFRNKKIYARQCEIKEIDSGASMGFLDKFHLYGKVNAKVNLGLYYDNCLFEVMTFSKTGDREYELTRFCTRKGYTIIGGLTRLLSYFKKNYEWNKIVSYSNNDLCTGEIYQKLGFNQVSEQIDFYYYDVKHKKILDHHKNDDPEKYTEQNGFLKCYNSGMKKYEILSI